MDLIGITLLTLVNTTICLVLPKVLHLVLAQKPEKKVRAVTVNVQKQDTSSEVPSYPY